MHKPRTPLKCRLIKLTCALTLVVMLGMVIWWQRSIDYLDIASVTATSRHELFFVSCTGTIMCGYSRRDEDENYPPVHYKSFGLKVCDIYEGDMLVYTTALDYHKHYYYLMNRAALRPEKIGSNERKWLQSRITPLVELPIYALMASTFVFGALAVAAIKRIL